MGYQLGLAPHPRAAYAAGNSARRPLKMHGRPWQRLRLSIVGLAGVAHIKAQPVAVVEFYVTHQAAR